MILTILIAVVIAAAGTLLFFKAKEIKALTEKANAVLDEFRGGQLGRITLERP